MSGQLPTAIEELKLALLKTPTAQLATNGGSQHPDKRKQGGHGPTLADEVEWLLNPEKVDLPATPKASDGEKGGPNMRSSKGVFDALPSQVHADRFGKYAAAVEQWERITGIDAPDPTRADGRNGNARLNPDFAAWMMNLSDYNIDKGLDRKAQLKLIGNAVVPMQAAHAITGLLARLSASDSVNLNRTSLNTPQAAKEAA